MTTALLAASSVAQGLGAAAGGPTVSGPINDRSQVNVAPVGVNLGQILQPAMQGSATNGGSGARLPSRWAGVTDAGFRPTQIADSQPTRRGGIPWWALALAAGAVGFITVKMVR